MTSARTTIKLRSHFAVTSYDHDPNDTVAVDIGWVDMRDFDGFLCQFFRTIGSSALTFKILANAESDGSGTDVTVKEYSGSEPDAAGDYVFLECSAEEIAQEAADAGIANARYVSANITFATGTDEAVVTYFREAIRERNGLTANSVA